MKIGLLTYHKAHNYGAVLQAFALYTVLREMGHQVEMIDYWPSYRAGQYDLMNFDKYFNDNLPVKSRLALLIQRTSTLAERCIKFNKFNKFIERMAKSDKTFLRSQDIDGDYDLIICGSDQIWRYNNSAKKKGFDDAYFGKYPSRSSVKKITYAASMGVEQLTDTAKLEFNELIKNLSSISVREDSLKSLVENITGLDPTHVVDPVFLLSKNRWKELVKPNPSKKPYLLFYKLLASPEAEKISKKIAIEKGLEIIEIRGKTEPFKWFSHIKTTTGPIDFITLLFHADYVVSTSFHGVAFSIIFNKQFAALGFQNNNSRVNSLLKSLEIQNALIDEKKSLSYFDGINYEATNSLLAVNVAESITFIRSQTTLG